MADPKKIGNAADELGEHLEGKNFGAANKSAMPGEVGPIEVSLLRLNDGLLLTPKRTAQQSLQQTVGDLAAGAKEQLAAAIFEDPAMAKRSSGNIERRPERGSLQFYAVHGNMAAAVWGERVMIQRDTMESAYSCRYCKGTGHTEEVCPTCKGDKVGIDTPEVGCRSCQVLGYEREVKRACGFVPCQFCLGAGHPAGIVIPESAKSSPISGIVVSCGPRCINLRLGDRVLFSRYSGHELVTPDGECFFTMGETEVLQLLKEI
jgi:co-chaperonin GroES (HSP10)